MQEILILFANYAQILTLPNLLVEVSYVDEGYIEATNSGRKTNRYMDLYKRKKQKTLLYKYLFVSLPTI